MKEYRVYLAGPISGLNYKEATDWREYAKKELEKYAINALSPMRSKDYLKDIPSFEQKGSYQNRHVMSSAKGIMMRDHNDCTKSDAILVNFLGAKEKSLGTTMEIAWAYDNHIPIVCIMEEEGNPHDHDMINQAVLRTSSLEEGIKMIASFIGSKEVKL